MKKLIIVVVLLFLLACNQKKSYLESLLISDIDLHIKYQDSIFKLNNKYPKDLYSYYDKLINDNSDSASVYYYRGRIDSIKSVTVDYYKKSLQKDSNFFYGLISLAAYSIDDDLTKDAIKFANKAKKKAPERHESYVILQNTYAVLHDKSDDVYQKLKYTKLAIENTEKAYQLTNDEKYLEYLNQYNEIKNNEENIINYNNAANQYINNYEFVKSMASKLSPNIKIIKLEYDNIDINKYNQILTSTFFWNLFTGSKILIWQEDSCVFGSNINDFIKWDYIGAAWPRNDNSYGVGNGGFSLRTKSIMMDIIMMKLLMNLNHKMAHLSRRVVLRFFG